MEKRKNLGLSFGKYGLFNYIEGAAPSKNVSVKRVPITKKGR